MGDRRFRVSSMGDDRNKLLVVDRIGVGFENYERGSQLFPQTGQFCLKKNCKTRLKLEHFSPATALIYIYQQLIALKY